ncbi:MAG: nicotinate (nicotinamide) nucleotide adenylyltransferase [Alistipes sp.]|nr:nicotinate (nicotinamide) nucleotide adenylyltransferase [Alistipes sp.]
MAKKRMMLYFGSFNPVHRGHTALAEYAIEKGLCDEVAMIISPQNPFKQDIIQAAEMDRYTMVEIACRNSRFPNQIKPSVIEFLLEKPSYTINTLRYLQQNNGDMMDFTILMGSDLINTLPKWREAESIIKEFDIYVYPRPNIDMTFSTERTTFLADAPQYDYSSTEIREALQQGRNINKMVDGEVLDYIREKKLWKAEQQ